MKGGGQEEDQDEQVEFKEGEREDFQRRGQEHQKTHDKETGAAGTDHQLHEGAKPIPFACHAG